MKKGQKQLFKFINKIFENAIILQQLRIDELKLRQKSKISLKEVSFPSGGNISDNLGTSNMETENHLIDSLKYRMKDARAKENEEGVKVNRHSKKPLIFAIDMGEEMKFPKKDCDCKSCRIEREILKNINKNDV